MKPGSVVLVAFPFSSLETTKKRPALVLKHTKHNENIQLITVAMITSKIESLRLKGDIVLKDWEHASLLHPSIVRLDKVATLDFRLIQGQLGHLVKQDLNKVKDVFRKLYSFWLS